MYKCVLDIASSMVGILVKDSRCNVTMESDDSGLSGVRNGNVDFCKETDMHFRLVVLRLQLRSLCKFQVAVLYL